MILRHALLTVCGLGLLKPAPGTWGSAPPPILVLVLLWAGSAAWMVNAALILVAVVFAVSCVAFGRWAERHFHVRDPRQVVADEIVGQCVALLLLPWREVVDGDGWAWNITLAATALAAFRFFDILKPPPIGALQRLPEGWGILLDDVLAGVYALGVTHALAWLVWGSLGSLDLLRGGLRYGRGDDLVRVAVHPATAAGPRPGGRSRRRGGMILRHALLTVCGLGLLKPAPGTWGSAPPPILVLVLLWAGSAAWMVNAALILVAVVFAVSCVAFGRWAERHFHVRDPRQVVADEIVGQCVALLLLPWREVVDGDGWAWNITLAATALAAFRFFDILKPPPIGALQRLPEGWGILLDDVLAGVYALGVTHALAWLVWPSVGW